LNEAYKQTKFAAEFLLESLCFYVFLEKNGRVNA